MSNFNIPNLIDIKLLENKNKNYEIFFYLNNFITDFSSNFLDYIYHFLQILTNKEFFGNNSIKIISYDNFNKLSIILNTIFSKTFWNNFFALILIICLIYFIYIISIDFNKNKIIQNFTNDKNQKKIDFNTYENNKLPFSKSLPISSSNLIPTLNSTDVKFYNDDSVKAFNYFD